MAYSRNNMESGHGIWGVCYDPFHHHARGFPSNFPKTWTMLVFLPPHSNINGKFIFFRCYFLSSCVVVSSHVGVHATLRPIICVFFPFLMKSHFNAHIIFKEMSWNRTEHYPKSFYVAFIDSIQEGEIVFLVFHLFDVVGQTASETLGKCHQGDFVKIQIRPLLKEKILISPCILKSLYQKH